MRLFRRVESGVAQVLIAVGAFLLATLFIGTLIGIANSNIFWGEDNQYGRVEVPGHAVLQLPSGSAQVSAAAALPGRGNGTPELLVPHIGISVVPVGGGAPVQVRRDPGDSTNADDKEVDTQTRIAYLDVPSSGTYRVAATGDFTGYGVNGQLWFGYEPGLLTGVAIWLVAAGVVLLLAGLVIGVSVLRGRRRDGEAKGIAAGPANANVLLAVAVISAALLASLVALATSAAPARAETIVPVEGPWSATTSVGLPVHFEVKEGTVVDPHFSVDLGECGHHYTELQSTTPIDPNGHWSFADSLGQSIEGTFIAPDRLEGAVTSSEGHLPYCPHTRATFGAAPGEVPPYVRPRTYAVVNDRTGRLAREPEFITLSERPSFDFYLPRWQGFGNHGARAEGKGEDHPRQAVGTIGDRTTQLLIKDGPGKLIYSRLHYVLRGDLPDGFPRRGTRKIGV